MPQLRKDPVLGRWVVLSTERGRRPSDFGPKPDPAEEEGRLCPFCPGNEKMTPPEILRLPTDGPWSVRIVPNRFPALSASGEPDRRGIGIYDQMNGIGAHEVIIETPDHRADLADLGTTGIAGVIQAVRRRVLDLAVDDRIRYVLVFKNHGQSAGASLSHSHCQLIATPVVPVLVKEELAGAAKYYGFRGRCIFCDMLKQELDDDERVVSRNDSFVAFEPFAPRFPFETWILPREHFASYDALSPDRVDGLAETLNDVLAKLNRTLNRPDYNLLLHVAPLKSLRTEHYHFHVELMPKLTRIAGFEVGSGFYINPVPPEEAARYLRDDKQSA